MRLAYNPIDCQPISELIDDNITFDLAGRNIFVKGVKFSGVDDIVSNTNNGLIPLIKDAKQDVDDNYYILTSDGKKAYWNKFPNLFFDRYSISGEYDLGYKVSLKSTTNNNSEVLIPLMTGASEENSGLLGLVPAPSKGNVRYLDSTGIWSIPEDSKVQNITTTTDKYYITGSAVANTNVGSQLFSIKNYIDPKEGIYSNNSLVINTEDLQNITGVKIFNNSPIIQGRDSKVSWDNGDYSVTYESTTSWDKKIVVNKEDSSNKQFFGWEGTNDSADFAFLGINVDSISQSQYRFEPNDMYINNHRVITEDTITTFIDDKYVNIEGDAMYGPLSINIKNRGVSLGYLNNGGLIQLGHFTNETQVGTISGITSALQLLTLDSLVSEFAGKIIAANSISTYGKSRNNDSVSGIMLEKDIITITGELPSINFHYNNSSRITSSIVESNSGEITLDAKTIITKGVYLGGELYYFDSKGILTSKEINTSGLQVTDEAFLNKQTTNQITYNIEQEQGIDIGSVFVTKKDRNKESNIITKISIDDLAFGLSGNGVISISKQLSLTTDWSDTGITELTDPGTYIIQIQDSSKRLYSGVMSWSNRSSSIGEEILLHRAGSYTTTIYLRTLGASIQIAGSNSTSSTFTFNFKKMI